MNTRLTEWELAEIEERVSLATPGPWYVRFLDDDHAAGLVAVATTPDTGRGEDWPHFEAGEMVAATLVQSPNRYVDIADQLWDANANFIAHAREDVPRLVAHVRHSVSRTVLLASDDLPGGFGYPEEFLKAVELGVTNLEPWWIFDGELLRDAAAGLRERGLVPFARREDNDAMACWDAMSGRVVITPDGIELADFRAWLHRAVDDALRPSTR